MVNQFKLIVEQRTAVKDMDQSATVSVHHNWSGDVTEPDLGKGNATWILHVHDDVTMRLWTLLAPLVLLFGTFGNVMIILVHGPTTETMSSLSVYFVTLAVSDLLLLYDVTFIRWVYFTFGVNLTVVHSAACKLHYWVMYSAGVMSAWVLVAMTAQRAACVLWPHRANVLCTARSSTTTVVSLVCFTAVVHGHILYGFDVIVVESDLAETDYVCYLFKGPYETFLLGVWSWADLALFSALPFLCLLVSNGLLVWKLKASVAEARVTLGPGQSGHISDRRKKASSITATLLAVSAAFITLTFPMCCLQLVFFHHWFWGSLDEFYASRALGIFHDSAQFLWQINSAVNFYLYCLTGSRFRRALKKKLGCLPCLEDVALEEKETNTSRK